MTGIEARIAEVLTEHQRRIDCNHPAYGQCYCGFNPEADDDLYPHEAQAHHVAAAVVAELGLVAETAVGGVRGTEPVATDSRDVALLKRLGSTRTLRRFVTAWERAE